MPAPQNTTRVKRVLHERSVSFQSYVQGGAPPTDAALPPIRSVSVPLLNSRQHTPTRASLQRRATSNVNVSPEHLLAGGRVSDGLYPHLYRAKGNVKGRRVGAVPPVANPRDGRRLLSVISSHWGDEDASLEASQLVQAREATNYLDKSIVRRRPSSAEANNEPTNSTSRLAGSMRSSISAKVPRAFRRALAAINHKRSVVRRAEELLSVLEEAPKEGEVLFVNPFRKNRQRLHELDEGDAEDDDVDRFTKAFVEGGRNFTHNRYGRRRRESRFAVACEGDSSDELDAPPQEEHPDGTTPLADALSYFDRRLSTITLIDTQLGTRLGMPPSVVAGFDSNVKEILLDELRRAAGLVPDRPPSTMDDMTISIDNADRKLSLGGMYERFLADLDEDVLFGMSIDHIVNYAYPAVRGVDVRACLPVPASAPHTPVPELGGTAEGIHPDKESVSTTPLCWRNVLTPNPLSTPTVSNTQSDLQHRYDQLSFTCGVVGGAGSMPSMEGAIAKVFSQLIGGHIYPSLPVHWRGYGDPFCPSEVHPPPLSTRGCPLVCALWRGGASKEEAANLYPISRLCITDIADDQQLLQIGGIRWNGMPVLTVHLPHGKSLHSLFTSVVLYELGRSSVVEDLRLNTHTASIPDYVEKFASAVRLGIAHLNIPGMVVDGTPSRHLLLPLLYSVPARIPVISAAVSRVQSYLSAGSGGGSSTISRTPSMLPSAVPSEGHSRSMTRSQGRCVWSMEWEVDAVEYRRNPQQWLTLLHRALSHSGAFIGDLPHGRLRMNLHQSTGRLSCKHTDAPTPPPTLQTCLASSILWKRVKNSGVGFVAKVPATLTKMDDAVWSLVYPPYIKGLAVLGEVDDVDEAVETRSMVTPHPLHDLMPTLLSECFLSNPPTTVRERVVVGCVGTERQLMRTFKRSLMGSVRGCHNAAFIHMHIEPISLTDSTAALVIQSCIRGWLLRLKHGERFRFLRNALRDHVLTAKSLIAARAKEIRFLIFQRSHDELLIIQSFEGVVAKGIRQREASEFDDIMRLALDRWIVLEAPARRRIEDAWLLGLGAEWCRLERRAHLWFPFKVAALWMWKRHLCETEYIRGYSQLVVHESLHRRQMVLDIRNLGEVHTDEYSKMMRRIRRRDRRDQLAAQSRHHVPLPLNAAMLL